MGSSVVERRRLPKVVGSNPTSLYDILPEQGKVMKKWHFGGRLCTGCIYNMVRHTGCAQTQTNFELADGEMEKIRRSGEKAQDGMDKPKQADE